ncbi:UDP-N-acetylglucosamine transferase subunit ALG14 [Aliamphritea ceti]|uniref:UDP-N-acetylglucosamine transferase subunit ALG14 n=1 Tax=Aliamphritea ceti TaxID=1524258 RepID=UPI0021C47269|nr:UDP-N-acetylglucosamine transferase subunit ALG14 [Aliamphritea ceti]
MSKKVLAVSSGGGHWVQLMRLKKSFVGCNQVYVTVNADYKSYIDTDAVFYKINDATRWDKFSLVILVLRLFWIIALERPDITVSTGAAPGYIAIRIAKLFGSKTIWIDSIANVEKISLSGEKISKHADYCLTQWEHLQNDKFVFLGKCL